MEVEIYIVIWKDRHSDTTAHPFYDLEKAKKWAKEQAESVCQCQEDLKEIKYDNWLYCINYSCESDCLYIIQPEVIQ